MVAATYQERLGALKAVLDGWGYAGAISEGFTIWNPSPARGLLRADFVAFTHSEQRDMSTSAIVAQVVEANDDIATRWVPAATALGAPAMLAALPDRLTLWTTAVDIESASEIASVPVTASATLVSRTSNLTSDAVARAKTQGHGSVLFPLGLDILNNSRTQARTYLTEQIEYSLSSFTELRGAGQEDLAAKLVIGALAILMIRDKTSASILADIGYEAMIDVAQQRYPGYFEWLNGLTNAESQAFSAIVSDLGRNINFASLEPAMVSDVYEQALVTKLTRRERGTFYTPPKLAHQMLRVIPFESLEPERRTVLDPACGSGTLLLAAAARLTQLQPAPVDSSVWHRYLISHLRGFDNDSLAVEITKLCLLMTAMPIGNSWQVDTVDTLNARINPDDRPSVIVSNPPWKFLRRGTQPADRANVFISWMLDNLADEGYLACVVPLSWLNKNNSRAARSSVLDRADLLEVWRLPAGVFHSTASTIAPAVIVAKKHGGAGYRPHVSLVKTVRDQDTAEGFLATGRAGETYLVEPGADGNRLMNGTLSRELAALEDFVTLNTGADIYTGWVQKSGRPVRSESDSTHYELGSLRHLRPFASPDPTTFKPVRYPEDYHHIRATDERVRAHKVIVASKHFSAENPWRLSVGFDSYGLAVREMFISVIPRPDWRPWSTFTEWQRQCAVAAVLGSGLASCWIDENEPTRNISIRYIKSFPLPTDRDCLARLADIGEAIAAAIASRQDDEIESRVKELEAAVNDVYRLSERSRMLIARRLAGFAAPEGVVRYAVDSSLAEQAKHVPSEKDVPSFGHVLQADENGLLLWVSGVTDVAGTWVSPPLQFPGCLCRSGTDFTIAGSLQDLESAQYGFHRYEWLSSDEITQVRQSPR